MGKAEPPLVCRDCEEPITWGFFTTGAKGHKYHIACAHRLGLGNGTFVHTYLEENGLLPESKPKKRKVKHRARN